MKLIIGLFLVVSLFGCDERPATQPPVTEPQPIVEPSAMTGWTHLSWTPPTENTDGSVLTDLDGYNIYYGISSGFYDNVISITNEGLTEYLVENMETGFTYYFVITAYNESGSESEYSNEVFKEL